MPRLSRYKFASVTLFVMGWLLSYPVNAQEMHWENVTVLNFVATGGTDREKYDSLWDGHDNVIEMLRFDKMLDVYDATSFQLLRTVPKPHD